MALNRRRVTIRPSVGRVGLLTDHPDAVPGELLRGTGFTDKRAAKVAGSRVRDAPNGSETIGAAKQAAMEKLRMIS